MPVIQFPLVRARRLAARPVVRRSAVVVLALVTGLAVASLVQSGEAARRSWGASRSVAVATRDLAPGDVLSPSAVEVRRLPAAVVPAGASASAPVGAVVRQPVVAGEPLVPARLAPDGLTGTAALVPEGFRAVAVPLGPGRRAAPGRGRRGRRARRRPARPGRRRVPGATTRGQARRSRWSSGRWWSTWARRPPRSPSPSPTPPGWRSPSPRARSCSPSPAPDQRRPVARITSTSTPTTSR